MCSGFVARRSTIVESDLDVAVMFGSRLLMGIFPPALRRQTMTINRKADMQIKEQALAKTAATQSRVSRYQPTDRVLAFLKTL